MATTARNAVIVTVHAVYALASFSEDQLFYTLVAGSAHEACGVVRVVASHDRLIEDRLLAHLAVVRAFGTDRTTVGEQ